MGTWRLLSLVLSTARYRKLYCAQGRRAVYSKFAVAFFGVFSLVVFIFGSRQNAEAACWYKYGVKMCNWEDADRELNNAAEWLDEVGGQSIELGSCGSKPYQELALPDTYAYTTDYFFPLPKGPVNFGSACVQHDACYGKCNVAKDKCDGQFWVNLRQECLDKVPLTTRAFTECMVTAGAYYIGVATIGGEAYKETHKKLGCDEATAGGIESETPEGGVAVGVLDPRSMWAEDVREIYQIVWGRDPSLDELGRALSVFESGRSYEEVKAYVRAKRNGLIAQGVFNQYILGGF